MRHRIGEIQVIDLMYYDRRLYSITPYLPCEKLNLDGLPVYGSDTEAVVLALAKRLQESPLLDGDSLEFRKSLVELYAFTCGVNKSGKPRYYTLDKEMKKKDSDFHHRHICLQTLPHDIPFEDWDKIAAPWSRYEEIKLL